MGMYVCMSGVESGGALGTLAVADGHSLTSRLECRDSTKSCDTPTGDDLQRDQMIRVSLSPFFAALFRKGKIYQGIQDRNYLRLPSVRVAGGLG